MMLLIASSSSDGRSSRNGSLAMGAAVSLLVTLAISSTALAQSTDASSQSQTDSAPDDSVTLTIDRAVKRTLQHPRSLGAADAEVSLARAKSRSERQWANPNLEILHEHLTDEPQVVDSWAIIEQTVPLAGRHALRELGDARVKSARQQRNADRNRLARQTNRRFYQLLAVQQKRQLLNTYVDWLEHRIRTLESRPSPVDTPDREGNSDRAQPGDLENPTDDGPRSTAPEPLPTLRHRLRQTNVKLRTLDAEFERLAPLLLHHIGASPTADLELRGSLLPDEQPPNLAKIDNLAQNHPAIRSLKQRAEMARHRDASGQWPNEISLAAGFRSSFTNNTFFPGYFAGVGIDLPVWSLVSDGDSVERATFEKRRAEWRRRVEQRSAELVSARGRYKTLRDTCRDYRNQTGISLDSQTPPRQLDPQRPSPDAAQRAFETRLQWIELTLKTRQAYIALEALAGEWT